MRSPIRRGNDAVREKTVVLGNRGTEFRDLSNKEELHKFVQENRDIVEAQSKGIDLAQQAVNARRQLENADDELNQMPRKLQPQKPPSIEEQRAFLQQQTKTIDHDPQEAINIADIPAELPETPVLQKNTNKPDWMDEEAEQLIKILNISQFPLEQQRHIVNSNRKKPGDKKSNIITNTDSNDVNAPIDPPPISASQMRKKIESEMKESLDKGEIPFEQPKTAPRFHIKTIEANDEDFTPIEFVSGYVFYDFNNVAVRRFNIADAVPLHQAKESGDLIGFVNAVGATVKGCDVLDLTPKDFRNLLYFHQFNSFTKTPLMVQWESKYGNKNYYRIKERDLKYVPPKLTREEYQKIWKPLGLTVPTMRDWLFFETEELSIDEAFLADKAKWFIGDKNDPSFQAKIDRMTDYCSKSLEALESIQEFNELSKHDIIERVDVVDAKFDPISFLNVLQKRVQLVYREKETLDEVENFIEIEELNDVVVELSDQINEIQEKLERKEEVVADVETKNVDLAMLDFFPGI